VAGAGAGGRSRIRLPASEPVTEPATDFQEGVLVNALGAQGDLLHRALQSVAGRLWN
jgi:hypothetical protein